MNYNNLIKNLCPSCSAEILQHGGGGLKRNGNYYCSKCPYNIACSTYEKIRSRLNRALGKVSNTPRKSKIEEDKYWDNPDF